LGAKFILLSHLISSKLPLIRSLSTAIQMHPQIQNQSKGYSPSSTPNDHARCTFHSIPVSYKPVEEKRFSTPHRTGIVISIGR
jgi:hypothetical protein